MGDVNIKVTVKGNIAKRKQYYTGDIPDGSISMSKLAPDVMLEMNKVSDDITSLQSNKADKTALAAKADKSYNSGFIGGTGATLNGVGGAAIGQNAQASSGAALGNGAQASEGVGAGKNAYASHGAALGRDTKTLHGVAAGDGAQTVNEDGNPITAIQLGKGTNTEPNTAKFFDYTIMNADGTIPDERLSGNFYSKTEVDGLIADKANAADVYTKTETDNKLLQKADVSALSGYYNKTETDGLLDEKADTSALNNYYTKNETDTKIAEAQSLIPTRHIVDELPTENIDTNGTYWVPVDDPDEKNLYTEYAYINGAWEIIGNPQKVDLTDYYTKTETDNKLTQKADASTVASMETSIEELQSDFALVESDVSALQNSKADKNAGFGGFVGGSGASLIEPDSGDVTSGTGATGGAIGFEAVSDNGGSIGHKANSVSGGAVGYQATTTTGGAVGHSAQSENGGAIGNGAKARDGGAIGFGAVATFGGAMGVSAAVTSGGAIGDSSCAGDGFSGGYAARVATDPEFDYIDAIQLGQGTNNTPKTLQIYDYCLMNADGTIPPERLNDYYKKSYLDDKFSGYDTQMMMMSEAIMGKAELYDFNQLSKTVAAKADKPTITSVSGASPSVTLTDNTETQCGEVTALTLTLPSSTPNGYISSVIFTANSATPLTYPESIAMIGTDCLDGVFAPTAGVRYTVIVTYDGAGVVGYVAGYEVTA